MPKKEGQSQAAYDKARRNKAIYNGDKKRIISRGLQNKARAMAVAAGKASKGDGKHVHHVKLLDKGGDTKLSNLKVISEKKNKGWRRTSPEVYGKNRKA
jgi:hypothetical protein